MSESWARVVHRRVNGAGPLLLYSKSMYNGYMKREWFIFVLGLIVFLIPFLGFPRKVVAIILGIAGLSLMIVALRNIRLTYVRDLGLDVPVNDYSKNGAHVNEKRPLV